MALAAENIDVCLVLEGTYPVDIGGISTWVDLLIRFAPHLKFGVVRIGELPDASTWAFQPHTNVAFVQAVSAPRRFDAHGVLRWARDCAASIAADLGHAHIIQGVGAGLAGLLAEAVATTQGRPFVLSEHASYVEELARGAMRLESGQSVSRALGTRHTALQFYSRLRDHLYRSADAVTSLYPAARDDQVRQGAAQNRCWVIPNGVPAAPRPSTSLQPAPRVACVGRINALKGTDIFIEAAIALGQRGVDATFQLVGPADDEHAFVDRCRQRSLTADAPILWSEKSASQVWDECPSVVVLASRSEAQPFALLEAAARGIPVVVTDVGDCRRMVAGNDMPWGMCVPVGRSDRLAEAIGSLAVDPTTQNAMGCQGRRFVQTNHTVKGMVAGYTALYRTFDRAVTPCA